MTDDLVSHHSVGPPDQQTRRAGEVTVDARAKALGRHQLTYPRPDLTSWRNWSPQVLSELRKLGRAPHRLDIGTAGEPLTKRRPAGTYYRQRAGWYIGSDISNRDVLVKILATQPLKALDVEGRQLTTSGPWAVSTETWTLAERRRLTWSSLVDQEETWTTPQGGAYASQVGALHMPQKLKNLLIGVPEVMQRAILEGIDFQTQPWADAEGWGYDDCDAGCKHDGPCEHIVIAAISKRVIVALEAKRFPNGWSGWASRWRADREPSSESNRASLDWSQVYDLDQ